MTAYHGRHISGRGCAHKCMASLTPYFHRKMLGTFNVEAAFDIEAFTPAIDDRVEGRRFWLVRLNGRHYAWAYRWDGSRQRPSVLELVSKEPLPENLKAGNIEVECLERWSVEELKKFVARQTYWFQSFPWGPKRADSDLVWRTVKSHGEWSGKNVLDIGCHNGAHSFLA